MPETTASEVSTDAPAGVATAISVARMSQPCGYCGGYHLAVCPRVKAIEYHPNGMVARVEFHADWGIGDGTETAPCAL